MNDESDKDATYLVTEDERHALERVYRKCKRVFQLRAALKDANEKLQRLTAIEVDIQHALFEAGAAYDHRPYMRQTPMVDDVRRLIRERDEALAQYERVKTLTQLALGSDPGESILKLVAELKEQIEKLNVERNELTAALDFATGTEHEQATKHAKLQASYQAARDSIVALERTANEQFVELTKLRAELTETKRKLDSLTSGAYE
jgi:chromosome segregation ATPase